MRGNLRRSTRAALVVAGALGAIGLGAAIAVAHDLFLKPAAFFVAPGATITVAVLNGTFTTSEAAVDRSRLRDLRVTGPGGARAADTASWEAAGKETRWRLKVAEAGTHVLGASLKPRMIRLNGEEFNKYLEEDGVLDVLAERRRTGEAGLAARERYSKHPKAIIQAGDRRTNDFSAVLGYPAELVPMENPYSLRAGAVLRVRALVDGSPAPGVVVLAGGRKADGSAIAERSVRSDRDGVARVELRSVGMWYVKFIRMRRLAATPADSADYESKWATLTFAVR